MKKVGGSGREDEGGAHQKPGGNAPHEGAVYTVAGSSGHATGGSLNHPAMFVSLDIVGSVVIDVNGSRLDMKFLQVGGTIGDYLNLIKAAPPTTNPAAPSALVATAVSSSQINLVWRDNATNEQGFRVERSTDNLNFTSTAYDVRFSTSTITAGNFASASQSIGEPLPAAAGTIQTFTISGLGSGKTYYVALKTLDETNNINPLSNVTNVTTVLPVTGGRLSNVVIIASNAVWKYLDKGTDQSNAWRALAFPDAGGSNGPAQLGYNGGTETTIVSYGPSSSSKYITTYFRRHFTIRDPSLFTALNFAVQRDDGVVVYVNGAEVFRDNMPQGAIGYRTVASSSVSGTNKTWFLLRGPFPATDFLVVGDNVVAAEVHQRSGGSSIMDFNLELKAGLAAPSVRIAKTSPSQVVVRWPTYSGKRYRVQYTSTIQSTNWITLGNDITATGSTTSITNSPSVDTSRFYRVLLMD